MPDIEWHIIDRTNPELIVSDSRRRPPRWRWAALLLVMLIGIGLGVANRLIPEPAPRPTPVPSPTLRPPPTYPAIPAKLFQTIDREAQALADGDFETFRDAHALNEVEVLQDEFAAWGRPGGDRPVYEIVDFNLLNENQAWADIRQFRDGRYFRETRFYYREGARWLHGLPNYALWSGEEESLQTAHFATTYAVEDRAVLTPTLRQLEEDYQSLCRDLGCAALGQALVFTVTVTYEEAASIYPMSSIYLEIWLPTPRLTGFYEDGRAYDWSTCAIHETMAQAIAIQVYGLASYDQPGGGLLLAGNAWAIAHIDPPVAKYFNEQGDLTQKPLSSLETLWGVDDAGALVMQAQRYKFLRFVEQEYGAAAVTRLLGSIASAKSMSDAIGNGLGVPYAEFDQKWQAWLQQSTDTPR